MSPLRLAVGYRVFALGRFKHGAGGKAAGVGKADSGGVADVQPTGSPVAAIDALPRFVPGTLDHESEAALTGIPDAERSFLRLELRDKKFREVAPVRRAGRGSILARSGQINAQLTIRPKLDLTTLTRF